MLVGYRVDVAQEKLLIELLLNRRHANHQKGLSLRREALGDVRLEPAQHEGAQDFVESGNHGLLSVVVVHVEVEPFVELFGAAEYIGKQKIKESPKLVEVVLEGGAGEKKAVASFELAYCGCKERSFVLEPVRLVNHEILPGKLFEGVLRGGWGEGRWGG